MTSIKRMFGEALPVDESTSGRRLVLSTAVVSVIERDLPKRVRRKYHENVLYIAGYMIGDLALGITCILPDAVTTQGSFETDPRSHLATLKALRDLNQTLVCQVHSHPGSFVVHSCTDDEKAIVKGDGLWSIVIPHYGRKKFSISKSGFHCLMGGKFHLLSSDAAVARVRVLPTCVDTRTKRR